METPQKPRNTRRLLLRAILGTAVLIVGLIGVFIYQRTQIARHNAAISDLQANGAQLTLTDWSGHTSYAGNVITDSNLPAPMLLATLMGNPSVSVPLVDLTGAHLSAVEAHKMIPSLRNLIPKGGENEVGKTYIAVVVTGNPQVDANLASEMRSALPNCQVIQ